jgi:hypothetical protein
LRKSRDFGGGGLVTSSSPEDRDDAEPEEARCEQELAEFPGSTIEQRRQQKRDEERDAQ